MKCRTIGLLVTFALGLLVALPVTAAPPAGKVPRIGFLGLSSSSLMSTRLTAFREGLRELGYVEGQSIAIEYRWAEGKVERLPELAADLIQLRMDLIVASSHAVVVPLKQATSTLPIVMMGSHEPVARGLIDSFARPGGNVTGLAFQDTELSTKRLELLMEMVPKISRMAVLWEPDEGGITQLRATEGAAQALGLQLHIIEVREPDDFDKAFAATKNGRAQALIQLASPFFAAHRKTTVDLIAESQLPAVCETMNFVAEGCLMSYGPSFDDMCRRAAYYVDRILKGTKPADLPVEQPTKFELVINLKTAQALSLTIPPTLLFQADEVIR